MSQIRIRAVVFREGDAWVAQALEYDIGTQAKDIKTLQRRFDLTIKAELAESIRRTGEPFGGIPPAPQYFEKIWDQDTTKFASASESREYGDFGHENGGTDAGQGLAG